MKVLFPSRIPSQDGDLSSQGKAHIGPLQFLWEFKYWPKIKGENDEKGTSQINYTHVLHFLYVNVEIYVRTWRFRNISTFAINVREIFAESGIYRK
jgi:hypothetical protein